MTQKKSGGKGDIEISKRDILVQVYIIKKRRNRRRKGYKRDIGRESWLIGSGGIYCRGNGINNSYIPIGRLKLQESSQINGGINSVILLYSQDSLQTLRNINKNKKDTKD